MYYHWKPYPFKKAFYLQMWQRQLCPPVTTGGCIPTASPHQDPVECIKNIIYRSVGNKSVPGLGK